MTYVGLLYAILFYNL